MANIGFVGLGNIGFPVASRIAASGLTLHVYDVAGAKERAPKGAIVAASPEDLIEATEAIFLCLPSAEAGHAFIAHIADAASRPRMVIDTSTVGPSGAELLTKELAKFGIVYVDAPVSGGVARAYKGDLTSMVACSLGVLEEVGSWISAYSSKIVHVGDVAGQAQAMKLVNNYASVACMLSTSEAISYGLKRGLDMSAMLDVINTSSGQSFVSSTLFPNHIANGAFDSAAPARIVAKDLALFVSEARRANTAHAIGDQALDLFGRYDPINPDEDWLHIFELIRDKV